MGICTYANRPFAITNINKKTKSFSNWYAIIIYFEDTQNTNGYYVRGKLIADEMCNAPY